MTALLWACNNGHVQVRSSRTFTISIVVGERAHEFTASVHTISSRSPGNCSRRSVTSTLQQATVSPP